MINPDNIKGVIFDYGGTIDSNGIHWSEVIFKAYNEMRVPVSKEVFRDAYVHGERTLGKNPIIKPHHTFFDMLKIKSEIQLEWLVENKHITSDQIDDELAGKLANWCYDFAKKSIDNAKPILYKLKERYPMVLVSNFYGNIESVLKDFGLDGIFDSIVESAVVGIRKPDPAIFSLGVERLALEASEVVVVGDSYDKDIKPSIEIGCQTIWLENVGWEVTHTEKPADATITSFDQLENLFRL